MSKKFYEAHLARMTSLPPPHKGTPNFTAANGSALLVADSVSADVKMEGCSFAVTFQVIDDLSQNIILGVSFMQ